MNLSDVNAWYHPPHLFGGAYRQMTPLGPNYIGNSGGSSLLWGDLGIFSIWWGLVNEMHPKAI